MAVALTRAAIVGAGAGGLTAYVALRYRRLSSADIAVFDPSGIPLATWAANTAAIGQSSMRSESEGHFFPTEFPGFALLDSIHQRSLRPLLASTFNRYHPTLQAALDHGGALARHYDMESRIERAKVNRIERTWDPVPHFELFDNEGALRARASHVLLALGHGPLRWPDALKDAETREGLGTALRHAYEPKTRGGQTILVVGSGMAAANEWVNALRQGGRVVSLRRRNHLIEQQLSAPRCAFGGPWLDRYRGLQPEQRADVLSSLARGTYPRFHEWSAVIKAARLEGRLTEEVGEVASARRTSTGSIQVELTTDAGPMTILADSMVAATGFESSWRAHEVLASLVSTYSLNTYGDHLVLSDDCSIPGLSNVESSILLSGPPARWAFPAADSFAGMKYASRRFAEHVLGRPGAGPRELDSWWRMVRGGWPYGGDGGRAHMEPGTCAIR